VAGLFPWNMGSGWIRGGVKGVELTVEGSGKVALERSSDFAVATAFLGAFGDVLPRSRVVNHPGHGDDVSGTVKAPITAPIEPVPDRITT
jgi:hypothetical protein